jgi:hypothetical protein
LARVVQPHALPALEARRVKLSNAPATNLTVDNGPAFEPRAAAAEVAFGVYNRDLQLDNPRFRATAQSLALKILFPYAAVQRDSFKLLTETGSKLSK